MTGVKRGEIKKLLVLEQLPKPANFSGGMQPLTIQGSFTLARILGTVPVEPDGSAYIELPALRSLFFVALDEKDLSVKRMQSFLTVQPGETTGCVGCHEQRTRPPSLAASRPLAVQRAPSRIEPIQGVPDVLDFPRDIQPILNKHCVECHNSRDYAGRIDLCGDHTPLYTISYWSMIRHRLVVDGRNRPESNLPPRSIGSSASPLMDYLDGSHHEVKLSDRERTTVRLWIESSATYPGTYASLGCGMYPVRGLASLGRRCGECHARRVRDKRGQMVMRYRFGATYQGTNYASTNPQSLCNLDHPADSILLRAPLSVEAGGLGLCKEDVFRSKDDPDYRRMLAAVEDAERRLQAGKRFDMPGFRPNRHYLRELTTFGIIQDASELAGPLDPYELDRKYWESFWYEPKTKAP
jgi:hypothetical protein